MSLKTQFAQSVLRHKKTALFACATLLTFALFAIDKYNNADILDCRYDVNNDSEYIAAHMFYHGARRSLFFIDDDGAPTTKIPTDLSAFPVKVVLKATHLTLENQPKCLTVGTLHNDNGEITFKYASGYAAHIFHDDYNPFLARERQESVEKFTKPYLNQPMAYPQYVVEHRMSGDIYSHKWTRSNVIPSYNI